VWDVRIEGNELLNEAAIISELEESGVHIGASWDKIDKGKIEIDTLSNNGNISWININRRGTVAYVVIKEKKSEDINEDREEYLYSNIVAAEDCIIEDISVSAGIPLVEIGDVVKKGDILILGANSSENGGGFCKAEGEVIGRVYGHESTEVLREVNEKTVCDMSFSGMTIKIFNFPINIFKTYGNDTEKCDIIKEIDSYSLFGRGKLPFEIERILSVERTGEMREYTDAELVSVVSVRLETQLSVMLADCDLLMRKTFGEFTEGGYRMSSEIVYLTEVGKETEIEILP
jgi:similar to stage IV sporulation protein